MKENMQKILATFLTGFVMFFGAFSPVESAPPGPPPETGKTEWGQISNLSPLMQPDVGYLEDIAFEKMEGKERVVLIVSKQPASLPYIEYQAAGVVLLRLENTFVPEGLRRPLGEGKLTNIIVVSPIQKTFEGKQCVYLTIVLKKLVPCSIRQEGQKVLIDFNVAGLTEAVTPTAEKPAYEVKGKEKVSVDLVKKPSLTDKEAKPAKVETEEEREKPKYTGHKISLDFQDANIKSVFRLLSELSGISIVFSDDVKGNITVHMENVPWDQALDTILTIRGLGKRQEGNIVTVMTLEKIKKDEADRPPFVTRVINIDYTDAKKLTENMLDLLPKDKDGKTTGSVKVDEHSNALIIQATREDMTRLFPIIEKIDKPTPQILIKANIVETTKDTARNLGIQWGGLWGQKIGSQGLYVTPGGTGNLIPLSGPGSTTPPGQAFSGGYSPTSGVAGIAGQGFGVNFPASSILGVGPASMGLMFGTIGGNILELQLSAMQKDGKLNILSSPSLVTLDNQTAYTENGDDVPFVTPATTTSPATVTWKKAVLRLEITPHVIDGKNIKMAIRVKKDEPNYSLSVQGNPPIFVKETKTDLVVADGETIVISGLTKQKKDNSINGVPWLKDIPVLGWLFKGEGKSESMEEVLIFITPTILKPQAVAGIQVGP